MQEKTLQNPWVMTGLALICCLLWGSAFPAIKIGYRMFEIDSANTASQILFAGVRFALAGVMTILFGCIAQKRFLLPKKSSWGRITLLSLFQTTIQYSFFYISLAHTTGVKGSIIDTTHVFFSFLFASLLFHQEKLTVRKVLGCILGFAGVMLANVTGAASLGGGFSLAGEGSMFLAAASCGFAATLIRRYSDLEDQYTLMGYQFFIGGMILVVIGLIGKGHFSIHGIAAWLMLLYLAFIGAAAYCIWTQLLKYNPVSKVTIFGFAITCFAVILSFLLLHEDIGMPLIQLIAAILLTSAGIILVNLQEKART